MTYQSVVIAVEEIHRSRRFYEELFGLEIYQDYGINVSFTCGISLQQEFGWLVGLPEDRVQKRTNNIELCFEETDFDGFLEKLKGFAGVETLGVKTHDWGQRVVRFYDPDGHLIEVGESMPMVVRRFLDAGMTLEEVSKRMDVSPADLETLLKA